MVPLELFATDGSAPGTNRVGEVGARGAGGVDVVGGKCANASVLVTQAQDGSSATPIQGTPTRVEPDVDYAPLGAVSAGANRVDPRPGDDAKSLHHDLMVHGASPSTPGLPAWGDAVPAPVFPGAMGLRVAELLLSGSPVLGSSLVNWGQVEDRTE
jgi:hypothetical protein